MVLLLYQTTLSATDDGMLEDKLQVNKLLLALPYKNNKFTKDRYSVK